MGQGARDPHCRCRRTGWSLRSFALGQYPVTVADWNACHADGVCGPPPRMAVTQDDTPIHNVSWDDAQIFIAWLSRRAGHAYRLPTEAEWEYAARAGTTTPLLVGRPGRHGAGQLRRLRRRRRIRGRRCRWTTFQPNPFGLYGMLGGVAQWVQDCWFPNYTTPRATARRARRRTA